jgi:hypothetical protein
MRKLFFSLFATGITALLYAQDPASLAYASHWPSSDSTQHSIAFSGEYFGGSDGMSNYFMNRFYRGGFIDSSMKANEVKNMYPTNRLGLYASYGVAYTWRNNPDSLKWEFTLALRDRQFMHGLYATDAFRLLFEGNRPFAGQTADMSGTNFVYMHWQQIQFETKYHTPDKRSQAVIGISYLSGQQYNEANVKTGKLYTASNGTAIQADLLAGYAVSDTSRSGMFSNTGNGISFNFNFKSIVGDSASKFRKEFMFAMQDLGYIRWSANTMAYTVDTVWQYNGVNISNAILNPDSIASVPNADSIIGTPVKTDMITFLPISLRARYTITSPTSWMAGIDLRLWSYASAIPHVTLFGGWHTKNKKFELGGGIAYGGYSKLQIPIQVNWTPCKNFSAGIYCWNAPAYIIPKKTTGQGIWTNFTFAF